MEHFGRFGREDLERKKESLHPTMILTAKIVTFIIFIEFIDGSKILFLGKIEFWERNVQKCKMIRSFLTEFLDLSG